ncbi:MAG: pyruvate kinase [Panacagrimonas sp.]
MRRTKILATLGPATDDPEVLVRMLAMGVDVVRLNFSHGEPQDHIRRAKAVKMAAASMGRDIGILCDLQGPKIRIECFGNGAVDLVEGQDFVLDTGMDGQAGTIEAVACSYQSLAEDVRAGDVLLLNDGAISLTVESVAAGRVHTKVLIGGRLSNRKGINKQGGGLSAAALTDKDRQDLRHAVALGADFIAVSFPRSAQDMHEARDLVHAAGGEARLVAKIERAEALADLDALADASDALMVARGDLGVEIGDAELPAWQKRIIAIAREKNRIAITATQMMESMIQNPIPTRAEVLDVANAVIDGTDAVMLSAETAAGQHPVKVVEAMKRVCIGAESGMDISKPRSAQGFDTHFHRTDEAIAMATTWTAANMHAKAIVSLTDSGSTALMMSRTETGIPIYALTPHDRTRRYMSLCRGVHPIAFVPTDLDTIKPVGEAVRCVRDRGLVSAGDRVLVTKGDFTGPGGTNAMKIVTVESG